jgi:hypothetical protein
VSAGASKEDVVGNRSSFQNILIVGALVVVAIVGWNVIWWLLGAVGAIIALVIRLAFLVFVIALIYYLVRGKPQA